MDLQTINQEYGQYIWKIANRYHTGIWTAEDVFDQILLQLYSAINGGQLSDTLKMRVKSFIITKAIDIIRYEKRRHHLSLDQAEVTTGDDDEFNLGDTCGPSAPPSLPATQLEIDLIRELLFTRLEPRVAEFILELAFPTYTTIEIAMEEQAAAQMDDKLRMNVHELKILPKHVAKYMARGGQSPPSPATVSRMRAKAREKIYGKEEEKEG